MGVTHRTFQELPSKFAAPSECGKTKRPDGLLKDEFVSAIRDTFFASQKSLWKKEVLQVVERSFDTITNLVKGQRFLRRHYCGTL